MTSRGSRTWPRNWLRILASSELTRARTLYAFGLLYLLVGYLGTNEIAALNPLARPALPIATAVDGNLPFLPWAVIFYVMYYPLLITPIFLASNAAALIRLTIAQAGISSIAYLIFILFPTPIDRPPAPVGDGLFYYLLESLFRADHPYNTFPSLHVAQSCIIALFFMAHPARFLPAGTQSRSPHSFFSVQILIFHGLASVLIAVSAVLIKQHYVADVMSGALLAGVAYAMLLRSR